MRQKNWLKGIASALPLASALLLAAVVFGMALSACAPEVDGPFGVGLLGGGSGFLPSGEIYEKLKDLPSFKGDAVSSEDEARKMANGAMEQLVDRASKELITIDGTYGGYTISGKGMKIYQNEVAPFTKYNYDCAFTVSYNGKGMKIIYTGSMDITSTGKNAYKLHYTVYNNNNTGIYNFDYNISP